jgi:hypothetical protein
MRFDAVMSRSSSIQSSRQTPSALRGVWGKRMARPLVRLPRKVLGWLYCRRHATLFELDAGPSVTLPKDTDNLPPAYNFRLAGSNDMPACAALTDIPQDECRRRIEHGEQCYAVFCQGEPVCVVWAHVGSYYVRGLGYCSGENRVGYLYNLITRPSHRGKGLYKFVLAAAAERLFARKIACLHQIIEDGNSIPLTVVPAFGYQMVHRIAHTRVCGLKITALRAPSGKTVCRRVFFRSPKGVFRI